MPNIMAWYYLYLKGKKNETLKYSVVDFRSIFKGTGIKHLSEFLPRYEAMRVKKVKGAETLVGMPYKASSIRTIIKEIKDEIQKN